MERRPPTAQGHGPPKEPRTVRSPTPGLTKETMNVGPETSSKLTHTGGSRSGNTPELVARVGLWGSVPMRVLRGSQEPPLTPLTPGAGVAGMATPRVPSLSPRAETGASWPVPAQAESVLKSGTCLRAEQQASLGQQGP